MLKHTEPGSAVGRTVTAIALACVLIVTAATGTAHASVLKKCPTGSSLSSAAGTKVKLYHQSKSHGLIVCGYGVHGSVLAVLTVETLSTNGESAAAALKNLEASAKAGKQKVTVLHGIGSGAFQSTIKGASANVYVAVSGQIVHVGSLLLSPSHLVAIARVVVG